MRHSISLGRVFGVPVGLHWSLLFVGALLAVGLTERFVASGTPISGAALVALGATAVFFGSVLAHELAHSVVAVRHGTPVEGITLWLLGGVARLGGTARSAAAELRIALAGPASSLALAALFGTAAYALAELGVAPGPVGSALAWLATINAVLAVFNLLPGAPLDGGRVLAAALWHRHGDRLRAEITAARVGGALGWGMVGFGVLQVLAGAGFWFILLGWYLSAAARAEEEHARQLRDARDALASGRVVGW
jgi:Zn-dependent protease